jgi:hypothetical protein
MPTQESIRLNNMKRLIPEFDAPCQQDKPETIAIRQLRSFDLSLKDDQLLAKKSIFHQKFGSTAAQISNRANSQRDGGWFYPIFNLSLNQMRKRSPERAGCKVHLGSGSGGMKIKTHDNVKRVKTHIFS